MTEVSSLLTTRWRSGRHIGPNKPSLRVQVQKGRLRHHFAQYTHLNGDEPEFGEIIGSKHPNRPWHAYWVEQSEWIDVPNVSQLESDTQFDQDGVADPTTMTIEIQNVVYQMIAGLAGQYTLIKRGWMAPWYGFVNFGRKPQSGVVENTWYNILNGRCRIKIWQGYGDSQEPTFIGLVDDCDMVSNPDTITVTARSFGSLLTDQRLFGRNKAKDIERLPVVFADRNQADDLDLKGTNAKATSNEAGHPPRDVLKKGDDQYWVSGGRDAAAATEWIEIQVPKGRYESVYFNPKDSGYSVYMGVFLRSDGLKGGSCKVDDVEVDDGWLHDADNGGTVPGVDNGGWPYIRHWPALDDGGQFITFKHVIECGNNTTIRIGLRNLKHFPSKGDYRARVNRLAGRHRKVSKEAKNKHWIEVDDAADVVRWILMWAGFREWNIKNMGVRLKEKMTFHQADYMIDVIRHMCQQGNYVFYIDQPSDDDDSWGVPHFVPATATVGPPVNMVEVRDTDLLTGVEAKHSKQDLSYIIRARGRTGTKKEGATGLGEDKTRRIQASYFTPWSGEHHDVLTGKRSKRYPFESRLAGLLRHASHTDEGIDTKDEALMFCILTAMQEALASFVGTIEIPGYPGIWLNEQISIVDTGTGLNTRMWVSQISSTQTAGTDAEYNSTVAGALLDTPDMLALIFDYAALLQRVLKENEL